ncbi:hypothetical protein EVAR_11167_1 [Eumeta japonica]|uniref:Uncharacterized protein n=1 Tax=Eumeta variegata TaxID=151549 RepID=A0A4C1U5L0_EUMVA|nr:hypothetical protein EVAR_11167_1 [Eumeta japonica]
MHHARVRNRLGNPSKHRARDPENRALTRVCCNDAVDAGGRREAPSCSARYVDVISRPAFLDRAPASCHFPRSKCNYIYNNACDVYRVYRSCRYGPRDAVLPNRPSIPFDPPACEPHNKIYNTKYVGCRCSRIPFSLHPSHADCGMVAYSIFSIPC